MPKYYEYKVCGYYLHWFTQDDIDTRQKIDSYTENELDEYQYGRIH